MLKYDSLNDQQYFITSEIPSIDALPAMIENTTNHLNEVGVHPLKRNWWVRHKIEYDLYELNVQFWMSTQELIEYYRR